ncbi:LPS assembly protein LptD [Serratia plymuthica]|uniref:LPS-assembly protein LptD n=1 Tax=Serratia plymuthica S13 TaxID=1348660 RepID=S4YC09_SERPL|nr:LPS assembly protein LptD [Serratia plymuthica]AGP42952.1 LPS assembly outer membrane complex protein LptD [Serratia plymuthica S13]ANJ92895.1 LPS biosynthesis protein [Serratia plymuthica]ANJ97041.1 LPS biosynthesis protein [Serratia plymuthica]EKF66290.1 LPS-assembly protein lptD [Serratia plymuthica A30]MBI6138633.1 LPS assembly protein LptD [Serratia plymuthica]
MKKSFPTLLATMIWTALYSQHALADLAEQCMLGVPVYDKPLVSGDPNSLPVTINADDSKADYPKSALFTGNVNIEQGNSTLTAKQVELNQTQTPGQAEPVRTVTATGDVHYSDNQIKLKGPKAWSNLNNKDTDVYEGDYQMVGRQGRGDADKMKMRGANRYTILENGTFTSCLPGDNSWSVVGSEVIHDREEQVAEVWNARFKIGGVPVFYSPYLQLPVGDKRRSGFLIPNAKYGSSNGFEFMLPYYWNIAPNFDATITPHYMSKRGLQWQNEFRYLVQPGLGLMEFDWLPDDKEYSKDNPDDSTRWLFFWKHNGVMDQVWRFNVDYTKVSDSKYFTDLDSKYGSTTDGYATQKFSVGYAIDNWDATLSSKQFQIYDDTDRSQSDSYKVQPQLDLNYYKNDLGPFDLRIYGQAAKFTSVNPYSPDATRLHLEPTLNLPLTNGWASLNTEAKLLATHYQQDIPDGFANNYKSRTGNDAPDLQDSVNRVLPQFKVDGKLVFERPMIWTEGATQTLEPRFQYLYVPYRDQSNIYTYDTTLLQTDYSGLFRDRAYSGLDRIASQNRVSTGLTTRIYDDALVERFNASVGQIYYFSRSRTGDQTTNYDNNDNTGSLAWAGDTYWKIDDRWGLRGGLQYDTRLNSISLGNGVLEYRQDAERVLQLNYRYATPEYIQTALNTRQVPAYQDGISQVGVTGSWPIVDRWSIVGAYYYDTRAQQSADQLLGLKYNTCCWAVTLGYERKITDWNNSNQSSVYDNKVSFNIELRGLSSDHSLGSAEMLRSGILPYQRAF